MYNKIESLIKPDAAKWAIGIALVAIGIIGFYVFPNTSALLRVIILLALSGAAFFIVAKTVKGQFAIEFTREAYLETRKVVWPTRQETLQTTLVVFIAVIILCILIWLLDSILFFLVRLLTGQGG